MYSKSKLLVACAAIPAAASASVDETLQRQMKNQWFMDGAKTAAAHAQLTDNTATPKGVVLFIGDGMGISTVTAGRIYAGQQQGKTGEEHVLSWEKFPNTAWSKTYNVNQQTPDSAGTATAFLAGVKTDAGVLLLDEQTERGNCTSAQNREVLSIMMMAEKAGLSTGIVSTARITHATPGASYASSADRNWEFTAPDGCKDIASQLIDFMRNYGDGFEVVLGGGRRNFFQNDKADPEYTDTTGKREDGRDLTAEWTSMSSQHAYVWNRTALLNLNTDNVKHVLGLFEPSHMKYHVDHDTASEMDPTVTEMTNVALKMLRKNPKGYVLLVESGRIDHGHHDNRARQALTDMVEMDNAVQKTVETVGDEALVIVTADHSHVFTIGGYQARGNDILGLTPGVAADKKRFTTLGYLNGPEANDRTENGVVAARANASDMNLSNSDTGWQALIPLSSETHAGEDVPIYATGPHAHLFRGVVEQNVIFSVMDAALGLSGKLSNATSNASTPAPAASSSAVLSLHVLIGAVVTIRLLF